MTTFKRSEAALVDYKDNKNVPVNIPEQHNQQQQQQNNIIEDKQDNKDNAEVENKNAFIPEKVQENTQENDEDVNKDEENHLPEANEENQQENTEVPRPDNNENDGMPHPENIQENPQQNNNENDGMPRPENNEDPQPNINEENIQENTQENNEQENKIDENNNENNQGNTNEQNIVDYPEKVLVSVVVPAFESQDYIYKCMDSLVQQTLKDIEIIIVDNSEDDKTLNAISKYMASDKRIRYFHNERNIGPGPARNMGIEAARGEYVGFVDSDDYVSENFYEVLYNTAKNTGDGVPFDIVKGLFVMMKNGAQMQSSNGGGVIRGKGKIQDVFVCQHFTGLFRREVLVQHPDARYGDTTTGEDLVFLNAVGYYAESMTYNSAARYYYVIRDGSLYHSSNPYLFVEEFGFSKAIIDFLKKVGATGSLSPKAAKTRWFVDSILKNNKQFEDSPVPYLREKYAEVKAFREELNNY